MRAQGRRHRVAGHSATVEHAFPRGTLSAWPNNSPRKPTGPGGACASTRSCGCWLAVVGQTTAVLVVYFGLDYELPIWACLAVIALAAWLNAVALRRFPMTQRLEPDRAAWLLAFDIAELAVLLFFTGGLQNPFAFLFLGPVLISATALPPQMTLMLGGFAIACATVLVFVHDPLPWDNEPPLELPAVYVMGVWARSCSRSRSSACTPGKSPRNRASSPMRSRRPNSCSRVSSTCHNSTAWRRRARAGHAARHHHADRQGAAARNAIRIPSTRTTCDC